MLSLAAFEKFHIHMEFEVGFSIENTLQSRLSYEFVSPKFEGRITDLRRSSATSRPFRSLLRGGSARTVDFLRLRPSTAWIYTTEGTYTR